MIDVSDATFGNKFKFCMIYQISGCMHATEQILVSFRTFSKTRNLKNNNNFVDFLTIDSQIQCHAKCFVIFYISGCIRAISRRS